MSISLTYSATTITIEANVYPEHPGRNYPLLTGRTMGGGTQVLDLGDGATVWTDPVIIFDDMTEADYNTLRGFIETTIDFGKYLCTFTDHRGTAHTNMRYLSGIDEFEQVNYDSWRGQIKLVKDMSA